MTGDDDLSQINELTLLTFFAVCSINLLDILLCPETRFPGCGEGCTRASAAPPKAMQGCKNQSNVGTKMASANNNLK